MPTARTRKQGPSLFHRGGRRFPADSLRLAGTQHLRCCLLLAAFHGCSGARDRASRETVSSVADTLLGAPGDARELGALAASPGLRIPGVLLARGVFEGSGSGSGRARQYSCWAAGLWGSAPCPVGLDFVPSPFFLRANGARSSRWPTSRRATHTQAHTHRSFALAVRSVGRG